MASKRSPRTAARSRSATSRRPWGLRRRGRRAARGGWPRCRADPHGEQVAGRGGGARPTRGASTPRRSRSLTSLPRSIAGGHASTSRPTSIAGGGGRYLHEAPASSATSRTSPEYFAGAGHDPTARSASALELPVPLRPMRPRRRSAVVELVGRGEQHVVRPQTSPETSTPSSAGWGESLGTRIARFGWTPRQRSALPVRPRSADAARAFTPPAPPAPCPCPKSTPSA